MEVPAYNQTYVPVHLAGRVINAKQVNAQVHVYLHNRRRVFEYVVTHLCRSWLTDVDECREQHPCTQKCVNTIGSYRCACSDGYSLSRDGHSCQSIPSPPPRATPPSTSQTTVGGHADAGK